MDSSQPCSRNATWPRRVLVYDTAELGAELAYRNAVADGAGIVVGPLTREDVARLVATQSIPVPTLVLNSQDREGTMPAFMYEFTLDPEQEARAAARRIVADGHTHGIALFPSTSWGERVHAAFTSELQASRRRAARRPVLRHRVTGFLRSAAGRRSAATPARPTAPGTAMRSPRRATGRSSPSSRPTRPTRARSSRNCASR